MKDEPHQALSPPHISPVKTRSWIGNFWLDAALHCPFGWDPDTLRPCAAFSIIFLLYIKNECEEGERVFTRAIRAESTLRDQTGLLLWWPHWDSTCLLLSHESLQRPTPPDLPYSTKSCSLLQCLSAQMLYATTNWFTATSDCVGSSPRAQFPIGVAGLVSAKGYILVFRSGSHGPRLTGSHDPSYKANTVRLWLPSSGNGYIKKEVNPHVGTRPGLWHVIDVKKKKRKRLAFAVDDPLWPH